MNQPIGLTRVLRDADVSFEIERIYSLLQNIKIGSGQLDMEEVVRALARRFRDGQLHVLNRFLEGETEATHLKINTGTQAATDMALEVGQVADTRGGTFRKSFPQGSDPNPAWLFSADDDSASPCVQIDARGRAPALHVRGVEVEQHAQPLVIISEVNPGTVTTDYIQTTAGGDDLATGARLTSAGQWSSACSLRGKIHRQVPMAAWFFEKLKRVRCWLWTSRRDATRHLGPCLEDFRTHFHTTGMSDYDLAGAALTGVKLLADRVEFLERRVARLEAKR